MPTPTTRLKADDDDNDANERIALKDEQYVVCTLRAIEEKTKSQQNLVERQWHTDEDGDR